MSKPIISFIGLTFLSGIPLIIVLLIGYIPPALTPNNSFFKVTIDGVPQIDTAKWSLQITGHVDHPITLNYSQILTYPNQTEIARLQCVDGPSGVAEWTGVPLNILLNQVGVQSDAISVVFFAADGYSSSLALPKDNQSDVLLAWGMNGVPLPADQGFPIRVVAPNNLGYKWVKWVSSIEIVDYDYEGYWESRGWSNNAHIASVTDWRLHALLFSITLLLGGLATISGIHLAPELTQLRELPDFVNRKFHGVVSSAFILCSLGTFIYWSISTFLKQGSIFFTFHGILGLISMILLVIGGFEGILRFSTTEKKSSHHGRVALIGFGLFVATILLGFLLTANNDIFSRLILL
jgi:hypothetical protein